MRWEGENGRGEKRDKQKVKNKKKINSNCKYWTVQSESTIQTGQVHLSKNYAFQCLNWNNHTSVHV